MTEAAIDSRAAPLPSVRTCAALLGLSIPLYGTVTLSPLLNGAAMDALAIDSFGIGSIRTIEILANALLTIGLSPRLARLNAKTLGLCGAGAMLVSAMATTLLPPNTGPLLAARLCAGLGGGLCQCALSILIAGTRSPQKVAGALMIPITLAAIATALAGGHTSQTFGGMSIFCVLAAACAIGFVLTLFAPGAAPKAAGKSAPTTPLDSLRSPYVLAAAMCFLGSSATWAFFERKGKSLGLLPADISNIMASALIAAGLLATLSMFIRDSWTKRSTTIAVTIFSLAAAATILAPAPSMFAGAYVLQTVAYAWSQNLLTAFGVQLDRSGGLAAAGRGWSTLANATAPALGGALLLYGGFAPLAILCLVAGTWTVFFLIRSEKFEK